MLKCIPYERKTDTMAVGNGFIRSVRAEINLIGDIQRGSKYHRLSRDGVGEAKLSGTQ